MACEGSGPTPSLLHGHEQLPKPKAAEQLPSLSSAPGGYSSMNPPS